MVKGGNGDTSSSSPPPPKYATGKRKYRISINNLLTFNDKLLIIYFRNTPLPRKLLHNKS